MALRKEGPETRSFGDIYPRPRVVLDRKVKYGNVAEGTYRITNGLVTARCDYRGDVGAVRVLARRYWVGAYIVPDRQKLLVARQAGRTISFSQKITFFSKRLFGRPEP